MRRILMAGFLVSATLVASGPGFVFASEMCRSTCGSATFDLAQSARCRGAYSQYKSCSARCGGNQNCVNQCQEPWEKCENSRG